MGSKAYKGVWFTCYSHDHLPPHVHAEYSGISVIIDLLADGTVGLSRRKKAIWPRKAKRSHVRHVLAVAAEHYPILKATWEYTHAKAD